MLKGLYCTQVDLLVAHRNLIDSQGRQCRLQFIKQTQQLFYIFRFSRTNQNAEEIKGSLVFVIVVEPERLLAKIVRHFTHVANPGSSKRQ